MCARSLGSKLTRHVFLLNGGFARDFNYRQDRRSNAYRIQIQWWR